MTQLSGKTLSHFLVIYNSFVRSSDYTVFWRTISLCFYAFLTFMTQRCRCFHFEAVIIFTVFVLTFYLVLHLDKSNKSEEHIVMQFCYFLSSVLNEISASKIIQRCPGQRSSRTERFPKRCSA